MFLTQLKLLSSNIIVWGSPSVCSFPLPQISWKEFLNIQKVSNKKVVCETRWESRVLNLEAVKVLVYWSKRCVTRAIYRRLPIRSQLQKLCLSLSIWMINMDFCSYMWFGMTYCNKSMQFESIDQLCVMSLLHKCYQFVKEYRDNGYASSTVIKAKEIAQKAKISQVFQQIRNWRTRCLITNL